MFLILDTSGQRRYINLDHVAKVTFVEGRVVVDDETGEDYEAQDMLEIQYADLAWAVDAGSGWSEPMIHQFYGDAARKIDEGIADGLYAGATVYTIAI